MEISIIENGGVTSPEGYLAAGVAAGIKNNGKRDLALVVSEKTAVCAGVFTRNVVKGHSLQLTMHNLEREHCADAFVVNQRLCQCVCRCGRRSGSFGCYGICGEAFGFVPFPDCI